jgi:hypothetical protein
MDTTIVNEKAQTAFRAALDARSRAGHWTQPEVDAYLNAEEDVRWEEAKERFDAMLAADHGHHLYAGYEQPGCEYCVPENADWWLER